MKVVDKGHQYLLLTIDGIETQFLTFVKREGKKFPGNTGHHCGTTIQSVIRALLERLRYLQGQFWCLENWFIIQFLRISLWLLEFRAARRHEIWYTHSLHFAEHVTLCQICGHTFCLHKKDLK